MNSHIIKTIEEARCNASRMLSDRLDNNLHLQWKDALQQILEDSDYEQEDKVFGSRTTGEDEQMEDCIRQQLIAYADTISELNQNRLLSNKFPVVKKFKSLSDYTKCDKNQERAFLDSWNIISNLSNESGKNGSLVEGAYLCSPFDKIKMVEMNRSLIESGKSWLETEFIANIDETLRYAEVGSSPSVEHRIQIFIKLTYSKDSIWTDKALEIQQGIPIWLHVYYLIRSGHSGYAMTFVDHNVQYFYLSYKFPGYLKEYFLSPNRIVSEQSRMEILAEYQNMNYGSILADPYKLLLYKIIGRCELQKADIPSVINTIDDFMWVELSSIREFVEEERFFYEKYRLSNLQERITNSGPFYFDPTRSNPWLYYKTLLLSMQFEKAVEYLYNSEHYELEAVHFGIALAYYGLIRIPQRPRDNTFDLLITEFDGSVSLNFSRLISQYVGLFLYDDSQDSALQYMYLITFYPTDDMKTLCRQQIIDYVVISKHHQNLIGCTNICGDQTSQGVIEKFTSLFGNGIYDDQLYKDTILYPIAKKFEEKGTYENAVSVFALCKKYTEALQVLIYQLDSALTLIFNNQVNPKSINLVDFSTKTKFMYENNTYISCSEDIMTTFDIVLGFLQASIAYSKTQYIQTIEIIHSTNIFPKENNGVGIKYAVDRLKMIKNDIFCKHIRHILNITLDSYYNLYIEYSKYNPCLYNLNQKNIKDIRNEVSMITRYLGSIDFDIPNDVFRDLNKYSAKLSL